MLIDPPLTSVYSSKHASSLNEVKTIPLFSEGYMDFIAPVNRKNKAPKKETMFKDILFYLQEYPDLINQDNGLQCNQHDNSADCSLRKATSPCIGYNKSALAASFVLKKLILAHLTQLIGFLNHQVSSMGSHGWSVGQNNDESVDEFQQVKKEWLRFRSTPIRKNLDLMFNSFAISREGSDVSKGWDDWRFEFRWLKARLEACSTEYQAITGDIAALSNLITSTEAVEESKRTAELAKRSTEISVYAFVLIPIGLIAGLFSMSGDYAPGGSSFWVFWAVAIPFTLLVLAIILITRLILAKRLTLRKVINLLRSSSKQHIYPEDVDVELGMTSTDKTVDEAPST
jgi:hypothetical protein